MPSAPASQFVERTISRLKFPQAFAVFAALFVFDLIVPDFVPFIDEILLGFAAALFGMWREKISVPAAPASAGAPAKPAEKNVTPTD